MLPSSHQSSSFRAGGYVCAKRTGSFLAAAEAGLEGSFEITGFLKW